MDIKMPHLKAARAVWQYVADSIGYHFSEALQDKHADTILDALLDRKPNGMNKTDLMKLFNNHARAVDIKSSCLMLQRSDLAWFKTIKKTGGRPSEVWYAK